VAQVTGLLSLEAAKIKAPAIETFARKNPVLMIFEDAHWADPASLEAFGRAVVVLTLADRSA